MTLKEKKLLEENNLILKTWVRTKVIEIKHEIKQIGILNMDLELVQYYRNLVAELKVSCRYGTELYNHCGDILSGIDNKLSKRYNELYAKLQANAFRNNKL